MNFGPQSSYNGIGVFTHPCKFSVLLRCQALHTANGTQPNFAKGEKVNGVDASPVRWRHIANVYETIEIRLLVSLEPKNILT